MSALNRVRSGVCKGGDSLGIVFQYACSQGENALKVVQRKRDRDWSRIRLMNRAPRCIASCPPSSCGLSSFRAHTVTKKDDVSHPFVCAYVCMCACACACVYVTVYVCVHACMHVCVTQTFVA